MTVRRIPVWSRIVLVVLLPILAYNIWDYVEMARLRGRVDALDKSHGPAASVFKSVRDATESERLYRAAAVLAIDRDDSPVDARNSVQRSFRERRWSPDALAVARAAVDRDSEALALVDRASALPFSNFMAGTSYNRRIGDLIKLVRLCELRAAVAADDGAGDAALASFRSEARLIRALDFEPVNNWPLSIPEFKWLSAAIERGKPSAQARDALGQAIADIDRDDRHALAVVRYRTRVLDGPDFRGPLLTHFAVESLDIAAELLAASQGPWPARLDAMNAVGGWPLDLAPRSEGAKTMLRGFTKSIADQIRRIRCARLIVSTTPLDLVDPLTGKRLEVSSCHL